VGTLTIVGTGIQQGTQCTREAAHEVVAADWVFSLVSDSASVELLTRMNSHIENLADLYDVQVNRYDTYTRMTSRVLERLNVSERVCVAFYGHPSVFVLVTRLLVHACHRAAHLVRVLPGISAEDCLFADLGVDPGLHGCQSYEATDFIVRPRRYDTFTPLVIWQIGAIGTQEAVLNTNSEGLELLVKTLSREYPLIHSVVVYEASTHPVFPASIRTVSLGSLVDVDVPAWATLYVPPLSQPRVDSKLATKLRVPEISQDELELFQAPFSLGRGAYSLVGETANDHDNHSWQSFLR
jgi:uncharacterized protein YabN with tetrapyrrole methylase and pyrophosphatase domain